MRPILLLLLSLVLAVVASGAGGLAMGQHEGAGMQGRVLVLKVTCESLNGTTRVNVLLQLPNPGYKIVSVEKSLNGTTLLVNLTVVPPSGPVIQVIEYRGLVFNVSGTVENIVVLVNNTKVYAGSCTSAAEKDQQHTGETDIVREAGEGEHTPQRPESTGTWRGPLTGFTGEKAPKNSHENGTAGLIGSDRLPIGLVIAGVILAVSGVLLLVRR